MSSRSCQNINDCDDLKEIRCITTGGVDAIYKKIADCINGKCETYERVEKCKIAQECRFYESLLGPYAIVFNYSLF